MLLGAACIRPAGAEVADVESSRGVMLSAHDQALSAEAFRLAGRGKWGQAKGVIDPVSSQFADDLFFWLYYLKSGGPVDFRHVAAILRNHPDWPKQGAMRVIAEKAMPPNMADADIIAWFQDFPPKTFDALFRYLAALHRSNRDDDGAKVAVTWWRGNSMTPDQQVRLYNSYGAYFTLADNLARLNSQLLQGAVSNARAIAIVLGRGYPALVDARIALMQNAPNAPSLVENVPSSLQGDPGLLFQRVRYRRMHNDDLGAVQLLNDAPDFDRLPNPEDWWNERQIVARHLMSRGDTRTAYDLVSQHIDDDGSAFTQAEFLAGWLALIGNHQPFRAFEHFNALYKNSDTPSGKSRAAYWAGRASESLNHPEIARQWYQTAARHQTTFYGQLAIGRLDEQDRPLQQTPPPRTVSGLNAFNRLDMAQAARLLNQAGFRQETTDFLNALSDTVQTPEQYGYVADLSRELDHLQNAVRIAKKGLNKGVFLMDAAFPTILKRMRGVRTEWALVHGIIRQESQFDYTAVSPVGARGMMQVMPATAAGVARKIGLYYRPDALTSDPDYNIKIGSAYLDELVQRYNGSYPLAVAAYNAGPGRVNQWLSDIGDPRPGGNMDYIDWIEQIPITETRNYVQRVLEAVYIYRIKLRGAQESYNGPLDMALDR